MAETYGSTGTGSAGMSGRPGPYGGTGSQSDRWQGAHRADDFIPESRMRPPQRWRGAYGDVSEDETGSRVDDLVPVLGILIGGAVGYVLATTLGGSQSESTSRGSGRLGMRSGRGGRSGWTGMSRSRSGQVEHDETTDLIASNKVEGTAVYNRKGERLGEVYNFMVGKRSGRVAYAVMSFGGFLGMGQRYHALPWNALDYETEREGYVIDADKDMLMKAPSYQEGDEPFSRADQLRRIREFWSSGRAAL
jgi:hypothetical protein